MKVQLQCLGCSTTVIDPFFLIDGQFVSTFKHSSHAIVTGVSAQIPPNRGTQLRSRETPPKTAPRADAAVERDELVHQVDGMGLFPRLFQPKPRAVLQHQQQVHWALHLGIEGVGLLDVRARGEWATWPRHHLEPSLPGSRGGPPERAPPDGGVRAIPHECGHGDRGRMGVGHGRGFRVLP